jgi:hypothetical protein
MYTANAGQEGDLACTCAAVPQYYRKFPSDYLLVLKTKMNQTKNKQNNFKKDNSNIYIIITF